MCNSGIYRAMWGVCTEMYHQLSNNFLCLDFEYMYICDGRGIFYVQIRVVRECGGGKKFKVHSRTAGLSAIRLHVGSTTRAVREVTAGAAYLHTVPREEERRVSAWGCVAALNLCQTVLSSLSK